MSKEYKKIPGFSLYKTNEYGDVRSTKDDTTILRLFDSNMLPYYKLKGDDTRIRPQYLKKLLTDTFDLTEDPDTIVDDPLACKEQVVEELDDKFSCANFSVDDYIVKPQKTTEELDVDDIASNFKKLDIYGIENYKKDSVVLKKINSSIAKSCEKYNTNTYIPLQNFPGYSINIAGKIRKTERGNTIVISPNRREPECVNLYVDGQAFMDEPIPLLMYEVFVDGNNKSQINYSFKNGNKNDCHLQNLEFTVCPDY